MEGAVFQRLESANHKPSICHTWVRLGCMTSAFHEAPESGNPVAKEQSAAPNGQRAGRQHVVTGT